MVQINADIDEELLKAFKKCCIDKELTFKEGLEEALNKWLRK